MSGEGTLIEETGHDGPYHVWWTADNIHSLGVPVATDEGLLDVLCGGRHAFNCRCIKEYVHDDTGRALLPSIPARRARGGGLARMFRRMKVALVVRTFDDNETESPPP